ncbi:hypothetical protein QUF64_10350 [Anaerolineales bacterium HSG6]|nr:hypothetical protein [Anaerolineales bacterium HSG6]MDM8532314.1 hypothetical protein [Anaerolineales bacterium HSG25]
MMNSISPWFKTTLTLTVAAIFLILVPIAPLSMLGGLALLIVLPGAQWTRWLGLYRHWRDPQTILLSVTCGMLTTPLFIYWTGLLFGFTRLTILLILPLYILGLTMLALKQPLSNQPPRINLKTGLPIIGLILLTALGVFLAYFELETSQGYYPVQMEDWQKHYGVAYALRHTGIPPSSPFFYGMYPDEPLIYYYFLHLNGATLDLLAGGESHLHATFVCMIVLASLTFSGLVYLLARTMFGTGKDKDQAAMWALAFATMIGGLDIIPIIHRTITKFRENFPSAPLELALFLPREHIDNWISALSLRMNSFYAHHVWVPQHLTGLTIICLGCYLYLTVENRRKLLLIYPLLLFALLGHSTWIAVIVAASLFLFALLQIFSAYRPQAMPWGNPSELSAPNLFMVYALIALSTIIVAAPFIWPLLGENAPKSGIVFEIPYLDSWELLRPLQANVGPTMLARLLDLPFHFLIEMGALIVAGLAGIISYWRLLGSDEVSSLSDTLPPPNLPLQGGGVTSSPETRPISANYTRALLPFFTLLLVIGLLTVSLFASGRGWTELDPNLKLNNDLGLRAMMPGQLVLALFGGYFMATLPTLIPSNGRRRLVQVGLGMLIGLGLLSSGWEFVAMGLTKYQIRPQLSTSAYQTLQDLPEVTPPLDKPWPVVQHRLHREISRFQLSLGQRPISFATGEAIVFHRHVPELALAHQLSQQGFDNGLPVWSYQIFHNLGANYIFVGPAEREAKRHPEKYDHPQYFQHVYDNAEFSIYQVKPWPYSTAENRTAASFDHESLIFEGHFIDQTPFYPGNPEPPPTEAKGLVTAWRLPQGTDKNYTVFIHFVDEANNIVAQADHQLWAWNMTSEGPTSTWPKQLTQLDIIPVPDMAIQHPTPLSIRLGVWLPDTGEQFPVSALTLPTDEAGRLMIGQKN